MRLPSLTIGDLVASTPIIQGGMGIGVSRSKLASAVANEGGIGVISGVQIGFSEPDFLKNPLIANMRSLRNEIKNARKLSPKGILGINLMVAMNHYKEMVSTAVEEKIDLIISGAGLPKELPEYIKGSKTKIAPIVSSGKAAYLMTKLWDKRYDYLPDLLIIEGPDAGGHLGFNMDQLKADVKVSLSQIFSDVKEAISSFEEKYKRKIPVIVAGGIYTGHDIAKYLNLGASGVQMGTRFIGTEECDADIRYKEAFVQAKQEDINLVNSPVGLPGRALHNEFIKTISSGKQSVKRCYQCLVACNPKTTPYCISDALINAVSGNTKEGLLFTGSNGYRIDKIVTVKNLMEQLVTEAQSAMIKPVSEV